jgi:general stress protein 26
MTKKAAKPAVPKASRPNMPGYGVPQGKKGLLPWKWAEERLAKSHNYWMVTVRRGPAPHAMPVWGIWFDAKFYFSTGRRSEKAKNLARNSRCVVMTERAHEAVIVHGAAREITDPEMIARLGVPYLAKYAPYELDPKLGAVYAVTPRVAYAMYEKKFAPSATRWKF